MKHRLVCKLALTGFLSFMLLLPIPALAVPIFQVYIDEGTAGDKGADEDTWFSAANPFDLYVVGAYQGKVTSIDEVWLVVSVPEGENGTLSITSAADGNPTLLTGLNAGANVDILTNPPSDDGYLAKEDFLPPGVTFNEHYPFKHEVSDFLVYELGPFVDSADIIYDYNADDGTITPTSADGDQKEYTVNWSGFSGLHFDVIGRVNGTDWKINPASHDSTAVPEPATMLLLGSGLIGLAYLGRKRFRGRGRG